MRPSMACQRQKIFGSKKERQGGEAERCEPRLAGAASYLYNTTRYMAETA